MRVGRERLGPRQAISVALVVVSTCPLYQSCSPQSNPARGPPPRRPRPWLQHIKIPAGTTATSSPGWWAGGGLERLGWEGWYAVMPRNPTFLFYPLYASRDYKKGVRGRPVYREPVPALELVAPRRPGNTAARAGLQWGDPGENMLPATTLSQ